MRTDDLKIGIALSGGGSRAIAFHLGCLRTLDRLGILDRARVMATVSGGSVIGAMYAIHEGSFADFEKKVRELLKTGLVRPALRVALTTSEGPKAFACVVLLVLSYAWLLPIRWVISLVSCVLDADRKIPLKHADDNSAPRRFASRSTILLRTLDSLLFQGKTLGDLSDTGPRLVAIATELRTGSAFYFGRGGVGSWRIGKVDPARIRLAQAVTASAAFPLLLPALDEIFRFQRKDGSLVSERVTLTDGGVYDNLGLAPLWPDRDPSISLSVEAVNVIIACRAGYGLRLIPPSMFMLSRLKAAFAAVHSRAQNATAQRLFDLRKAGSIRSFAMPYLDQNDDGLAHAPADLVTRETVANYPTDFSAMSEQWIENLSKRGEQLTLAVIQQHAPELLPRP